MQIVRLNCAFSRNLGRGDDVDGLGAIMRGSLKDEADAHNGFVSNVADVISYGTGVALGGATGKAAELVKKVTDSVLGALIVDQVSGALQDEIVGWFTVRAGTYNRIVCQYDRNFNILGFIPVYECYTYELRIYPDYVEVWFSSLHCGLTSQATPRQKIGEMTMQELLDIDWIGDD